MNLHCMMVHEWRFDKNFFNSLRQKCVNKLWCCSQIWVIIWTCLWLSTRLLTHWGRVTHICVSRIINIGSDNGLSPGRRQAIIWTNDVILWIRPLGTNFSEILIEFLTFWFKKMRLNVSSVKWRPFCLGLNVLTHSCTETSISMV